jgi:hypothetical protein
MKNSSSDIQTLADMITMLSQNAVHQSTSDTAPHLISETYCNTPLSGPLKLLAERSVNPTETSQPEDMH